MKKSRGLLLGGLGVIVLALGLLLAYQNFATPTKIALVHFPSYQVSSIANANEDWQIKVQAVSEEKAATLLSYDAILIFGPGFRPTIEEEKALEKAKEKGIPIYSYVMRSNKIQCHNITEEQEAQLDLYYKYRSKKNYRNLLRYIRRELDPRKFFSKAAEVPEPIPEDLFYYLDDERYFNTADELTAYLRSNDLYHEQGKRIALISGTLAPLEGNRAHVDSLITGLTKKGYNVYPFISLNKRLDLLAQIQPDGLVYIAMGRLAGNEGDAWLKKHNVPIFSPIPVNQTEEVWLKDRIGLSAGALTARVTLAELDGSLLPMVVATENEQEDGLVTIDAQLEGIQKFMESLDRYMRLRERRNADKKIAIVYFRGAGSNSLVATGLEVAPSLYNFLRRLQAEGYDVSGLPRTREEFARQLHRQGTIWGQHTPQLVERFIQNEHPEVVPISDYEAWVKKHIDPAKYDEVVRKYGTAPGTYMNTTTDRGEPAIAIARLRYGNVVLLPQQASSFTEDQFKMVHGVDVPPPHSYLAEYLWIHEGFDADALIHFGTHGNLEFIPGKQVALSHLDWPDALVGSLPHFYYYSISNIGESIIAKRRSHAAIVSYLTPPFMESKAGAQYQKLFDLLETVRTNGSKESSISFKRECIRQNIHNDLQLDDNPNEPYSEEETAYIENFLEEIVQEKITGKLYTLGEPFSPQEIEETVRAMGIDAIAYQWAQLDRHQGKITSEEYESPAFISRHYIRPLAPMIAQALKSGNGYPILDRIVAQASDSATLLLVEGIKASVDDLLSYHALLTSSPELELEALIGGLNGNYIAPGPGGDAVRSPNALPTGRNLYSINAESTPTEKAWNTGKLLAEQTLQNYFDAHGSYPKKVSYTFWAGEFIESEGATVAQAMAMIGVEPIRDRMGRVADLRLMPESELGHPRIDVVVQVSGQLRDLATSRLVLLNNAITLAADAPDASEENFVRSGSLEIERQLVEQGTPPAEARVLANMRIFGGLNGHYGTGIKELVEKGDAWNDRSEIAETYMKNMGAIYGTAETWGEYHEHLLRAALSHTDVVVQPRQNNTWGALSLDHMYEFMGGLSNAVENVTGKAPEMYLSDYRNRFRPRMQGLKEAMGVESRTTLFNPAYIKEKMKGGASTANTFAKTIRNAYGWESMREHTLGDAWWDQLYNTYVEDALGLGIQNYFERTNPAALQEITAVMLETSRKGMWSASQEKIDRLAQLHSALTLKYGASGSEFSDSNEALQKYITEHLSTDRQAYQEAMRQKPHGGEEQGVVLKQETFTAGAEKEQSLGGALIAGIAIGILLLTIVIIAVQRRRK